MANKPKILNSKEAYDQFLLLLDQSQFNIKEEAGVLFVTRSNQVLGGYKLSSGGIKATVIDLRIILGSALKCLASGLFIAHTHPSGELKPSQIDLMVTARLVESAALMDIKVIDHLILSEGRYLSMADDGLM